jgi:hypothetical protein
MHNLFSMSSSGSGKIRKSGAKTVTSKSITFTSTTVSDGMPSAQTAALTAAQIANSQAQEAGSTRPSASRSISERGEPPPPPLKRPSTAETMSSTAQTVVPEYDPDYSTYPTGQGNHEQAPPGTTLTECELAKVYKRQDLLLHQEANTTKTVVATIRLHMGKTIAVNLPRTNPVPELR